MSHLEQQLFESVAIILQTGRAKVFKGQVKVSNTFHVTKLLVNEKVEEIQDFKNMILSSNNPTFSISHVSLLSARTAKDELEAPDASVKTVDYLYYCEKVFGFVQESFQFLKIGGILRVLIAGRRYIHPVVDNFYCVKCDDLFQTGVLRYMITVQVVDEPENATLLCWDRNWENLIGKSCTDLRKEHLERGGEELPEELSGLIGKKLLFKVQIKSEQLHNYSGIFFVAKLTTNPDLIWKYRVMNLRVRKNLRQNLRSILLSRTLRKGPRRLNLHYANVD